MIDGFVANADTLILSGREEKAVVRGAEDHPASGKNHPNA
jgi:hypothetical protein